MNDWTDLEHKLWHVLRTHELIDQKFVVALSGGLDSLALLRALSRVARQVPAACFIHHGDHSNKEYRDAAQNFCKDVCAEMRIPLHVSKNESPLLNSEAEMRDFRYEALEKIRVQTKSDFIALGHHRDDLLETRLLRLIRGTGPQGLVAMSVVSQNLFRPYLQISKQELKFYLEEAGVRAIDDPTNADLEPLRNWLRQSWLVDLETRQPGAVQSLARSLELLVDAPKQTDEFKSLFSQSELSRSGFVALSKSEQKRALAQWLLSLNVRNFTQAHLEEVVKRLDKSQNDFTFRVAGLQWFVNAQQIRVQE